MTFQTPVTVEAVLRGIHKKEYLLPAIQREFVWDVDQMRRLFDSLLRGYPIGSFLFWQVNPETAAGYTFYDFITDYHQRDHPYAPKAHVPGGPVVAILDGQQRLTALNIGVYGSHAEKVKYLWWTSPNAFPKKHLFLNLGADADPGDLGLKYDLRFLTDQEAQPEPGEPKAWFRVRDVLDLQDSGGPAMLDVIMDRGFTDPESRGAFRRLHDLHRALREFKPINYYLEESQDPNKVLDIFVRVNSGGTTLSYSDLLLSMATNQWVEKDAREEVRSLVIELNSGGNRTFSFSKDVVLKSALMVSGVDVRFRVSNFTQSNMKLVEDSWDQTRVSLLLAAELLDSFGLNGRALTAHSAVLPIAYYLAKRSASSSYLVSTNHRADREAIRTWVVRSLLKKGVWGSGLDTLLTALRTTIDGAGPQEFPAAELEAVMAQRGKALIFDETEVDELLRTRYGSPQSFLILSLLYPGLDFSKSFHEDHIYPRSEFGKKSLRTYGVSEADLDTYRDRVDRIPNLQLLAGGANTQKQATLPGIWVQKSYPDDVSRRQYFSDNDIDELPGMDGFLNFFDAREARLKIRLAQCLDVGLEVDGAGVGRTPIGD